MGQDNIDDRSELRSEIDWKQNTRNRELDSECDRELRFLAQDALKFNPGPFISEMSGALNTGETLEAISIIRRYLGIYGGLIRYVPADLLDDNLRLIAIRSSVMAIQHIPMQDRSDAVCDVLTKKGMLWDVPEPMRTNERCKRAVAVRFDALPYVPSAFLNETIVWEAVRRSPTLMWDVYYKRPDIITERFVLEVLNLVSSLYEDFFVRTPDEFMAQNVYERALAINGRGILHVPHDLIEKWPNLLLIAINKNREAYQLLDDRFKDEDLTLFAVESCPENLSAIPNTLKCRMPLFVEVAYRTIEEDCLSSSSLWRVPLEYRGFKMCYDACVISESAFSHVPSEMLSEIIAKVEENWDAIVLDRLARRVAMHFFVLENWRRHGALVVDDDPSNFLEFELKKMQAPDYKHHIRRISS